MTDQHQLRRAIAALSGQANGLEATALATTLAVLRDELAALEQAAVATNQPAGRKQITVLFAQIDGLSVMLGGTPAAERADLAARVWNRVDDLVAQFGGVVDKHMGDVVMAVFGLRQAREDDVERAVRCALAIAESAVLLSEQAEWLPTGAAQTGAAPPLSIRVGVNTGPVLVGRLGTDSAPTVIGDTVNVASRLRQAGDDAGVYLAASTWRFVQHRYEADALGPVEVRGRSNPVSVYRLQGPRPIPWLAAGRTIGGVSIPLVGRDPELTGLIDEVRATHDQQQPHLLTLAGDAGVGKSRLVGELMQALSGLELPILRFSGRSEPRLQRVPYSLLRSILRSGSDVPTDDVEELAQADAAYRADRLWERFVSEREGSELIVLTLEDIHWADRESLAVVEQLLARAEGVALLVVAVARPALFERIPGWGQVASLGAHVVTSRRTVEPLNGRDTAALVGQILRRVPDLPAELVDLIVHSAGGNPYYVEELITVLIDDAVIQTGESAWVVQPVALDRLRVPDTLTGVVQARLDKLPESERQLLQQASIVGDEFWETAVRDVNRAGRFPIDDAEIAEVLQRLVDRELVRPAPLSAVSGQQAYVFSHAVLREVAYETVLLRDRQAYHLASARWLEAQGGQELGTLAAPIAEQYEAAHEHERASRLFELAAAHARGQGRTSRSIQYERRALDMLIGLPQFITQRIVILGRLGDALQKAGQVSEAVDVFRAQRAAAAEDGDLLTQARASLHLAYLAQEMGQHGEGMALAKEAEQLARLAADEAARREAARFLEENRQRGTPD